MEESRLCCLINKRVTCTVCVESYCMICWGRRGEKHHVTVDGKYYYCKGIHLTARRLAPNDFILEQATW